MSESFDAYSTTDQGSATSFTSDSTADRLHDAADAVKERVAGGVSTVRSAVRGASDLDVEELLRQHPWYALAGALALGAFLGAGAGEKAVAATAGAAAGAGRGAAELAKRAASSVGEGATHLAHSVADSTPPQVKSAFQSASHEVTDVLGDAVRQIKGSVSEVLHSRIDEFVTELRKGIDELGAPRRTV